MSPAAGPTRLRAAAGLGLAGMLLAACGAVSRPAASPAASPTSSSAVPANPAQAEPASGRRVTVELSWLPSANQMPFYLALSRGYYRRAGLDVRLISGKGSGLAVQQVGSGKFDLGQADLSVMALARAKGAPVESFMVEFERNTFGLLVGRSTGVTTWRDLYGKVVLVSPGSPETFLLPATFKKLGLDLGRVKVVDTSPQGKVAEYIQGKGAATGGGLPGVIPVVGAKRASRPLWFGKVLDIPDLGVFARRAYVSAHPRVVRGFTAATLRALEALLRQPGAPAEAYQAMLRYNRGPLPLTRAQFLDGWKIYAGFVTTPVLGARPLGWESQRGWATMLRILHTYAGLKGDLRSADYYTNAFVPRGGPVQAGVGLG